VLPETPFARLAQVCEALRATSSRLEKVALVAGFLREVAPEERAPAARFLAAKTLAEHDPRSLDVGWAALSGAMRSGQATLDVEPLTIAELARAFDGLASTTGLDSRKRKEQRLRGLLGRCSAAERPWLLALLWGEMRTGVSDGVVLEGIAKASQAPPELVRRAHLLRGDVGEVAALALEEGKDGLAATRLRLFHPLRPMMAEVSASVADALRELAGEVAFEFKFDGARIAIHKQGPRVAVFSRRLTDVTASVPEVVEAGLTLAAEEAVVEGEVVAYDNEGKPLPFQDLMRRFHRVHGIAEERARIPLTVHLFDCLHVDGRTLLDEPYRARWAELARVAGPALLAPRLVTREPTEAERFLAEALARGHEGLMAKDLASPYTPGKRGALWLKIKASQTLDCAIIGAEWGSGRREGWLSNYHLAVRVAEGEEALLVQPEAAPVDRVTLAEGWAMVGKTFKGLTDDEFEAMTARLQALAKEERGWGYVVKPEVVVEVEYNDIQQSPHYVSGFALRFARIKAIREDKRSEEADTLGGLRKLFEAQFAAKGRLGA
jgi:DNA ligase-1